MNDYLLFKLIGAAAFLIAGATLFFSLRRNRWYRHFLSWLGIVLGLFALAVGGVFAYVGTTELPIIRQPDRPTREEMSRPVESFGFRLVEDESPAALRDYRGKVIVLNLWATWCGGCVVEMPDLNRLQEEFKEQGLVVITLSWEPRQDLLAFAARNPFSTVNGFVGDVQDLPDPFCRQIMFPTSYVIDQEGYLQEFVLGPRDFKQWKNKVEGLL